jgi:hypothetical protein
MYNIVCGLDKSSYSIRGWKREFWRHEKIFSPHCGLCLFQGEALLWKEIFSTAPSLFQAERALTNFHHSYALLLRKLVKNISTEFVPNRSFMDRGKKLEYF